MKRRFWLYLIAVIAFPMVAIGGVLMQMDSGDESAAPPPSGQDFTVDFSEYAAADDHYDGGSGPTWIELACDTGGDGDCMTTGGGTVVDTTSDDLDGPGNEFVILYPTQTDDVTQYGAMQFVTQVVSNGLYFRSTNNDAERAYVLRRDGDDDIQWRTCTGYNCADIATCDPADDVGGSSSIGYRITGTGTGTDLEVWGWNLQAPPAVTNGDVDTAWGAPDCTLDGDSYFTSNPTHAADTGKYGGLYNGGGSAQTFDDFMLGDSTN